MNINGIRKKLKRKLDKNRYQHTLGVSAVAVSLAMRYGTDLEQAGLAALLHDCAKCYTEARRSELCAKYGVSLTEAEKANPALIHAKLGAYVARDKYGVEDPEVLSAITWHTTGRGNMSLLEKIIFVADYIEPNRTRQQNLKQIREMAFLDIDEAIYLIARDTLDYLKRGRNTIDPMTEEAFLYYQEVHRQKQQENGGVTK